MQEEHSQRVELQSQLDSALETIAIQKAELRTTQDQLDETKLAVDQMQAQAREKLAAQRKAIQAQSEGAAHRWRIVISVLVGILLLFFEAVTFAVTIGLQAVARAGLLIFLPVFLVLLAGTVLQVQWGLDIKKPYEVLNVFECWLSRRIERNLLERSGLIDYEDLEKLQEATKQGPSDASSV
jgi:cation transport ATPase